MAKTTDARTGDRHTGDPNRAVRISDELWGRVRLKADTEGKTLREAVVEALEDWVDN